MGSFSWPQPFRHGLILSLSLLASCLICTPSSISGGLGFVNFLRPKSCRHLHAASLFGRFLGPLGLSEALLISTTASHAIATSCYVCPTEHGALLHLVKGAGALAHAFSFLGKYTLHISSL